MSEIKENSSLTFPFSTPNGLSGLRIRNESGAPISVDHQWQGEVFSLTVKTSAPSSSPENVLSAAAIKKLAVKPGDVLVLELPEHYAPASEEDAKHVKNKIRESIGHGYCNLIITPPGCKLASGDWEDPVFVSENLSRRINAHDREKYAALFRQVIPLLVKSHEFPIQLIGRLTQAVKELAPLSIAHPCAVEESCQPNVLGTNVGSLTPALSLPADNSNTGMTIFVSGVSAKWEPEDKPHDSVIKEISDKFFKAYAQKIDADVMRDAPGGNPFSDLPLSAQEQTDTYRSLLPERVQKQPRPNPEDTWETFEGHAWECENLTGSVFIWCPKAEPAEAYLLSPGDVRWNEGTNRYRFRENGNFFEVPEEEIIIHPPKEGEAPEIPDGPSPWPATTDPEFAREGDSDVKALEEAAGVVQHMQVWLDGQELPLHGKWYCSPWKKEIAWSGLPGQAVPGLIYRTGHFTLAADRPDLLGKRIIVSIVVDETPETFPAIVKYRINPFGLYTFSSNGPPVAESPIVKAAKWLDVSDAIDKSRWEAMRANAPETEEEKRQKAEEAAEPEKKIQFREFF